MTVDEFADALISAALELLAEGQYENNLGTRGYWARYGDGRRRLWYSVSGTETAIAPDEVRLAIQAPGRLVTREKPYLNGHGRRGFEATVFSGGRAFMLSAAPADTA
jgi:hypothetical protein